MDPMPGDPVEKSPVSEKDPVQICTDCPVLLNLDLQIQAAMLLLLLRCYAAAPTNSTGHPGAMCQVSLGA